LKNFCCWGYFVKMNVHFPSKESSNNRPRRMRPQQSHPEHVTVSKTTHSEAKSLRHTNKF